MHAWRASCVSRVSCVSAAADSDLMALLQLTHLPFAWTKYRADRHPAVAPNTHRRNTRRHRHRIGDGHRVMPWRMWARQDSSQDPSTERDLPAPPDVDSLG